MQQIDPIQIFPDTANNSIFSNEVDQKLRTRSPDSNMDLRDILLTTRTANKLFSFNQLVEACAKKLNEPNASHESILLGYIAHLATPYDINEKKYNPADHQLAVAFTREALNESKLRSRDR